ncbi:MAG: SDR family NAD(P)-dependent oxidoreductase [Janthinobacterium lividum]
MDKHKVALVTGAGTGMGAEIVKLLATRGVNVVINHLGEVDHAAAQQTAQACREAGAEALVVQADVGIESDCTALVAKAAQQWGRLDYLVNNAAATAGRELSDLDGVTVEDFRKVYEVNCIGPFLLSRAAAVHMRALKRGAIVNVASTAGLTGLGSSHPYCATKAGLINMTRSLARVLGPEIRINAVCPGLVNTQWPQRQLSPAMYAMVMEKAKSGSILKSVIQPSDVAESVVWLLEGAPQITGEVVRVDGGGHLS